MTTKNAVIGTALGYNIENIKNFVLSFREYNTEDDIIILANKESLNIFDDFFKIYNVKSVLFESHKFIDTAPNNSRYIGYLEFVFQHPEYKNILLADLRDVVFQKNPFDNLPDDYLYFFREDSGVTIGMNNYNSFWIKALYNDQILQQLFHEPIICSGTILGSYNSIKTFLSYLNQELFNIKTRSFELYKNEILDQGITNFIVNCYPTDSLKFDKKNNGDLIGTVGLSSTDDNRKDLLTFNHGMVKVNNQTPAIIHQYDRNQFLSDYYNKKYLANTKIN